jgi:hypothetical protein
VPELPRLDDLVWLAQARRQDADRVLDRYLRDGRLKQQADKGDGLVGLNRPARRPRVPVDAA